MLYVVYIQRVDNYEHGQDGNHVSIDSVCTTELGARERCNFLKAEWLEEWRLDNPDMDTPSEDECYTEWAYSGVEVIGG